MAEVTLAIAGRSYRLACRDGDEPGLAAAAAHLDAHATRLLASLGAIPEARLLLMSGLLVAGELLEARGGADGDAQPAAPAATPDLAELAERLERLADRLEGAVRTALSGPGLEAPAGDA